MLSTPCIFTQNNQEADITVADEIPMAQGTTQTGDIVTTQIQNATVGIVLTVTPRVTSGDVVQMDVQVSADEVGSYVTVGSQSYPSTKRRVANSSLSIASGHTVILGGLMREATSTSRNGVPILSDIPLLGALFRSSTTHKEKTELLVFLTPRVVRNVAEAQQLSEVERNKLTPAPRSLRRPLDAQGLAASEGRYLPPTAR